MTNRSAYYRICCGVSTCFASSIAASLDEILEAKPTIFGSVPRIFEKAYSNLIAEVESRNIISRVIFAWAKDVGIQKARLDIAQMPIPTALAGQYPHTSQ
jgi:long-chain acyl-CoA synthetase